MKIVFPYLGHLHQVPHSLPIALELARRHPDFRVHVAYACPSHLPFIQRLVSECGPGARLQFDALRLDPVSALRCRRGNVPWKQAALLANREYFNGFDAIAVPERTSLFLRRIGVTRPRLIWTRHGAGDREVGFSRDVHQFDYVLMAGRRIEKRLLALGQIRPGAYTTGVYAKFDWLDPARAQAPRLFDNDRPTVLYNPHFVGSLSSWPRWGQAVLEQFAASTRYNLIFAPHVRLFSPAKPSRYRAFEPYLHLPHLRIDLGSERSVDMTYTRAADLYLGDVSSQVAEFIFRPRPCLFLDAHHRDWRHDASYASWTLGPVTRTITSLEDQVRAAFEQHPAYEPVQRRYFEETFELQPQQISAARGADAIVEFLVRSRSRISGSTPALALP